MPLPPTRQHKKLSEVLDVQSGYAFNSKKFSESEGFPLIRIRDIRKSFTNTKYQGEIKKDYIVHKGDFLIGMDGNFKCYIWEGEDALLNQRVCRLVNPTSDIDLRYIYYGINKFLLEIENSTSFVTVKHISSKQIKNISFPLPPLSTQKAIVAKLDGISASIQQVKGAIEEQIEKVDELWKSSIQENLLKYPGIDTTIGYISKKIQYGYTGKTVENGTYKYLRITDIQNNSVNRETVPFVSITDEEAKKYILNEGDIVFARTGATVGKSFLISQSGKNHIFASYLIRIIPDYDIMIPDFIKYFFYSNQYRDQIYADVVGAAQPNFNGKKLGKINITLPSIEHQKTIVTNLDHIQQKYKSLKKEYHSQLTHYDQLRTSTLDQAFNGKLVA